MQIELTEEELERVIDALEVAALYARTVGHKPQTNEIVERLKDSRTQPERSQE